MKKTLIAIISLLLITTMLFGCGKKTENNEKTDEKDSQIIKVEDTRIVAEKFVDGLLDLLPDTQAVVDNFNKINFEKGVYGEVSGFEIMGHTMKLNVGYDVANDTIGATLIQKNIIGPDSVVEFVFYGDYCYVDFGTSKTKVTPDKVTTLLKLFMGLDIDVQMEPIETEKIKNIVLALKDYDGDLANDVLKLVNEKFTWTESAEEIKVVIAGESMLAFKDAVIDLVVNNAGVKDKITREDIDAFIGEIDEDAFKSAFGVVTLTLNFTDSKATSLDFNLLTSKQDENDVNVSLFTQIDATLEKIEDGANIKAVEKTWKTDGTGGTAYERVQDVLAEGVIKLNGNVITYNGIDYKLEATVGESDITIKLLKPSIEKDENELNLDILIKGLEEEIKVPEV